MTVTTLNLTWVTPAANNNALDEDVGDDEER